MTKRALALLFLAPACLGEPLEGGSAAIDAPIGPRLRSDGKSIDCGDATLELRYQPLSAPVDGLSALPGIPLPALGPDADGVFWSPPGYVEGGQFPAVPAASNAAPPSLPAWPRVAEWNVARGEKLDQLIAHMRRVNADVWILNETDLYGKVARGRVIARELARALGYSYVTSVEFYERRDDRGGMSGNAIVSRYPLSDVRTTYLPKYVEGETPLDLNGDGAIDDEERWTGGYDWANSLLEPRCGQRSALAATIEVPGATGPSVPVRLVSVHTENLEEFDLELNGPQIRRLQLRAAQRLLVTPGQPTILAGDLNTLGLEPIDLRDHLERELEMRGATTTTGAPDALMDCSHGDTSLTHGAGHLDWILLQEGLRDAIACFAGSYRIARGKGSDHRTIVTDVFVRNP